MTTLTIEVDKDKDLTAIKEFIGRLGLKYQVDAGESLLYTDDLKRELDKRYTEYKEGRIELVDEAESKRRIQNIISGKNGK